MDFCFGLYLGHLTARADAIARRHGAWHDNYTEPGTGIRRGWFGCPNRGPPFEGAIAKAVLADIEAGGFDALLCRRDRS